MPRFWLLALIIALFSSGTAHAETTWEIGSRLRVNESEYGSLYANIRITEKLADGTTREQENTILLDEYRAGILRSHFGVQKNSELVGKKFISTRKIDNFLSKIEVADEFSLFTSRLVHGGKYNPPGNAEIKEQIAMALAAISCPKLAHLDLPTLRSALGSMKREHSDYILSDQALAWLQKRVATLSAGKVTIRRDYEEEHRLVLMKGTLRQLFLIGWEEVYFFPEIAKE